MALGCVALACALFGVLAWVGHGVFVMRGIRAVMLRDSTTARQMATYASCFSAAQIALGATAVALGRVVTARDRNSGIVRAVGHVVIGLGVGALLLVLLLV
jgi:hypothetical protein